MGMKEKPCGIESNSECVECTDAFKDEVAVVYKKKNVTDQNTCNLDCMPNYFKYESSEKCFACSQSVCGADEIGFSSLRIISGLQYTKKCTATQDSSCHLCESIDERVSFTSNGGTIGGWCQYECQAGFKRCPTCT